MFVTDDRVEIGLGLMALFHRSDELIQAAHAIQLFAIACPGRIESRAQNRERRVIGLQRNGKWMAVLAAVGEREARGIRESHRRSMHHFGNQSE